MAFFLTSIILGVAAGVALALYLRKEHPAKSTRANREQCGAR